jgi:hypothetical protein
MQLKQLSESLHGIGNTSETIQHRVSVFSADEELHVRGETLHSQNEQDISPTAPARLMNFRSYLTSSISEKTFFAIKTLRFHQHSQMYSCFFLLLNFPVTAEN